MKKQFQFLGILIILLSFSSCMQQNNLTKYNLAPNYTDEFPGSFMNQQIYHVNDSLSELSLRLVPSEIPKVSAKKLELYSYLTLTYSVYASPNKKELLQTNTYKLSELMSFEDLDGGVIKMNIPLHLKKNQNYWVLVSVQNPVDKQNFLKVHQIFKTSTAAENFRVLNENDELLWLDWIADQQKIKIQYRYADSSHIVLSYYQPQFGPALPPFSDHVNKELQNAKVFEDFKLALKNGKTSLVELPKKGLYKIHTKASSEGKSLLKLYDGFPSVVSESQKVFGLRYLVPHKEFSMMIKDDPAHTIHEFWFFEERTKERSEKMMRTYYARMLRANRLFTTYKEGWKTDRGMIFMIYGPPDQVYYKWDQEIWEYGPDASYNDLKFIFHKTATPFIQSEMILDRNNDFKMSWYQLLEHWRND